MNLKPAGTRIKVEGGRVKQRFHCARVGEAPAEPATTGRPRLCGAWPVLVRQFITLAGSLLSPRSAITLAGLMKAERRHELQTNSLALWLRWRFPQLARQYATRVLLGVIFALLIVVLIRYRMNAPKIAAAEAQARLSVAQEDVHLLQKGVPPGRVTGVVTQVREALDRSKDPQIQAMGYITLGDYYWALANYVEPPGATTQPLLYKPQLPHDQLLAKAAESYQKALGEQNTQAYMVARAHLGLAAVYEQQGFELDRSGKAPTTGPANNYWAQAKAQYEAVANAGDAPLVLKDQANWHLRQLPEIEQPVWIVPSTQPSATQQIGPEFPTTLPAGPTTGPTTRPI